MREHYGVPAEIGRRVIANGEPGVIMADRDHYIGVILDSCPKKRIRNYHPTWERQYGEMAGKLPLKRYQVLVNGWDWWDITNRTIVDVFASTPRRPSTRPTSGASTTTSSACSASKSAGPDPPALSATPYLKTKNAALYRRRWWRQ